jgi:hypothetical protein
VPDVHLLASCRRANGRVFLNLRGLAVSFSVGLTVACASLPAIPLRGSPPASAALVGEWMAGIEAETPVLMTPRDLKVPLKDAAVLQDTLES